MSGGSNVCLRKDLFVLTDGMVIREVGVCVCVCTRASVFHQKRHKNDNTLDVARWTMMEVNHLV